MKYCIEAGCRYQDNHKGPHEVGFHGSELAKLMADLDEWDKTASRLQCRAFDAQTNVQLLKDAVHVAEVTGIVKHPVLVG